MKPLLVFDIDGTLTQTIPVDDASFIQTFADLHQISLKETDWSVFPHVTDWGLSRSIFEQYFQRLPGIEELTGLKSHFLRLLQEAFAADPGLFAEVPGAAAFLHHLRDQGYPIAIATGGWEETARFKLKQIGIDANAYPFAHSGDHFARRVITETAIEKAQKAYGNAFSKVIYFGDGKWDFLNAMEMEIGFIGVDYRRTGKLAALGAEVVVADLLDGEWLIESIMAS